MGRVAFTALTAAACVVVWLQLDGIMTAARLWATVLLVPLPLLMIAQAAILQEGEPLPKIPAYLSSIISLWVLAALTLLAGRMGGMGLPDFRIGEHPGAGWLPLTAGLTIAGLLVLIAFRIGGFREAVTTRALLPETGRERLLFVAVSSTAGICEELIFRGFLLSVLAQATGSAALAVVVSSGAFGVLHAYQRPVGAIRAAALGAMLAAATLASGSLYPAVLAHTAIDVISGLWLARYLLR